MSQAPVRLPSLHIGSLLARYRERSLTPTKVIEAIIAATEDDPGHVWIHRIPADALRAHARAIEARDPAELPLYGVPFAIKDNIDLAGVPTTAGCPDFAHTPETSAFVVQRLIDAGAIPIGKTNLDQFATGLNGTRSPYGACQNPFNPDYISGGSSSGSAVAVAKGLVSFSLGTDTAGSGRVPAAFNNLVGLKPTKGLFSTGGVLPACRSLDTVSIFALTARDAQRIFNIALGFDEQDGYAREAEPYGFDFGQAAGFRFGVPREDQLKFFGDTASQALFAEAVARCEALGGEKTEIDFAPFLEAAGLLYDGPWVAERYLAIRDFIDRQPDSVFPVTRQITLGGAKPSAADGFTALYRLHELKHVADKIIKDLDCVLTPSAGTIYTIKEIEADPIALNSALGTYTNFMNLLDYSAIAVPAGFRPDGLPFGVTFFAQAHRDIPLMHLAARWQRALDLPLGATGEALPDEEPPAVPVASGQVRVAVCGAHLEGMPLNPQLIERGARLIARTQTAPVYRFYALAGGPPKRPGLLQAGPGQTGAAIDVEVWEMPLQHFGSFVAKIPPPLGIGKTLLADGSLVPGFICEASGIEGATDITHFGGWRQYIRTL
ncbi:allophanate hydrolase [Niveibacterium sp. SC-1]|uniref:allophanate hydrolase n=1 Tax=Niveibacterium sp. SC-1 TaxID=3135646 RepID=UPI00311E5366